MSSAALFLVAALAASSYPVANAASIAENEAAVRSQQAQICPHQNPLDIALTSPVLMRK